MRIVKWIVVGLAVFIALLAVVGFMLPSAYKVERTVSISAPVDLVFEQVNNLKKNEAWSPWMANDSTLEVTYSGPEAGVGATSSWTSKHSGSGSQTIRESVPGRSIVTYLDFGEMGNANGIWTFSQEGGAVKVTQAMTGDSGKNPFKHIMNLAMDMFIGKYFEQGLNALKAVSEKLAAEPPTPDPAPVASADSAATTTEPAARP